VSTKDRDDGLRRISTVTRWAAAGGIVLAGVLAAAVAKAAPGRSSGSNGPSSQSSLVPASSGNPSQVQQPSSPADQRSSDLSPPPEPPLYSRHAGRVSSGGS
jgi:hypothetical protein